MEGNRGGEEVVLMGKKNRSEEMLRDIAYSDSELGNRSLGTSKASLFRCCNESVDDEPGGNDRHHINCGTFRNAHPILNGPEWAYGSHAISFKASFLTSQQRLCFNVHMFSA